MKCQCHSKECTHGKRQCHNYALVELKTETKKTVYFCMSCAITSGLEKVEQE